MKHGKFIEKAIKWAEKQGLKKIRANYEDYSTPTQYTQKGEDNAFVPDVTGFKKGKKTYVEVALKVENISRKVSKWKLLSTLAKMKGGRLVLLAPRGHKAFTERILDKYNLEAKLVYLPNTRI